MPLHHRLLPWIVGMLISVWSLSSHAQSTAPSPQPTQADAAVPPLKFESALRAYRPLVAGRPVPWTQANERVNQIGGWRTYTREAHAPEPSAATSSPESPHAHH